MDSPPGELTSPLARAPKSQPYRTPSARRPIYSDSSDSEVDLWDAPASEMLLGARVSGGREGSDRRGTPAPKRAPPSSRRGMARRRVRDSSGGSTSTETRSSLSDTNDDARAFRHSAVERAVERAAASQATHPDAAYETFRASVRKSSLKLRSARGSRRAEGEAVGASDEEIRGDSSDESPSPRRESFLAPLRTRLADTAAFEREGNEAKQAVERDRDGRDRRDTRTRPPVSNVLDPARKASVTPTRDGVSEKKKDGADGATTLDVVRDVSEIVSEIVSDAKPTTPTTPTSREEEEGKEKEEENRVVSPRRVVSSPVSSTRHRETLAEPVDRDADGESRGARLSTPPPKKRASFESVSIRDRRSATPLERRRKKDRPRVSLAVPNTDIAAVLGEGARVADTSRSALRSAIRRPKSPRLTLGNVDSEPLDALLGRIERLERERDASVAASAEKTERREERARERERAGERNFVELKKHTSDREKVAVVAGATKKNESPSRDATYVAEKTRSETRIAEHDATTSGRFNDVVFDDERGFGGARMTKKALRTTLRSAATRAFGVSAFLAMAAALLLAAVDIFDIVDPAAPVRPAEQSRGLTGEVDRYWERDTGPVGRAARSALFSAPKELFAKAVADAKNALAGAPPTWVSRHARETENLAFDVFDDPVPAPS